MTHTPGPWRTGDVELHIVYSAAQKRGGGRVIARCQEGTLVTQEDDANARLIAAAPDLLQALIDALHSLDRLPEVDGAYRTTCIAQARAAIAKAKGAD